MNTDNLEDVPFMLIMPYFEQCHPRYEEVLIFHQSIAHEFAGRLHKKSLGQSEPVVVVAFEALSRGDRDRLVRIMGQAEVPFTLCHTSDTGLRSGWLYREGWTCPVFATDDHLADMPQDASFSYQDIANAGNGLRQRTGGKRGTH